MDKELARDIENYFSGQVVEPYEIEIYAAHRFAPRSLDSPDMCARCGGPHIHHLLARALAVVKAT